MDMTLLEGREGGSAVYARSLVNALSAIDDVQVTIVSAGTAGGLATAAWMLSGARVALRAEGAAVLHSPAFLTPLNPPIPTVITIHDLSLGRMPSGHPFEWRMYYKLIVPTVARRAAAIISPTETTRREVISMFGIRAERAVAIPSGVDERFFATARRDRSADPLEPIIVFPGPPIGRKNLDIVLRVMGGAPSGSPLARAVLEISGATASAFPNYAQEIANRGLEHRVRWLGSLPFEDVPDLYGRADLVVYPSFLEGFGFPPLEAMAVGTPVVASSASCLPEVLGDGALMVDPRDDVAFAAAVDAVLTRREVRHSLIAAGLARARTFTWSRSARATADVYRAVAAAAEASTRPVA